MLKSVDIIMMVLVVMTLRIKMKEMIIVSNTVMIFSVTNMIIISTIIADTVFVFFITIVNFLFLVAVPTVLILGIKGWRFI